MLEYIALYFFALVGLANVVKRTCDIVFEAAMAVATSLRSGGRIPFLQKVEDRFENFKRDKLLLD